MISPPAIPPIKKIILQNIQSLPKAEIEPAPPGQLTVIIGESDTGKTALASRALQKLFFNSIPTKELIRRGSKKASITVIYDTADNLAVSWEWHGRKPDAGKARYVIRRDGMKPIILEGGGKKVPEAVQELTGVRPIRIGNMTLNFNFNRQLDGPFLGNVSPIERYRVLGALAGTLEVDEAVKEVSLEIHRARRREKELAGEIEALGEKIREYDYLEELDHKIKTIDTKLILIQRKQERQKKLVSLRQSIHDTDFVRKVAANEVQVLGKAISKVSDALAKCEAAIFRHQKLVTLYQYIQKTNFTLAWAEKILENTQTFYKAYWHTKAVDEENKKLISLQRLTQNIATEKTKLTTAQQTLDATRNAEQAQVALEKLTRANHTLRQLIFLYAEISKTREVIKRNIIILKQTIEVGRAGELLTKIEKAVPRITKLRELAGRIQKGKKFIAGVNATLKITEGVERGMKQLARIKDAVAKVDKLYSLSIAIKIDRKLIADKNDLIKKFDAKIELDAREYRELLKQAGICEDCPVVDAVMAAS